MAVPTASTISNVVTTSTKIDFHFSTPSSNGGKTIDYFTIYCDTNPTPTTVVGTGYTSYGTDWQVTGRTDGTVYYLRVLAHNADGYSPNSNMPSAVYVIPPSVSNVSNITPGNATVDFDFSTPASNGGSAITQFDIYCDTNASPTTLCGTGYTTYGTHWQVTGRTNGTLYYVGVKASNSSGRCATYGTIQSATPRTVPGTVTGQSANGCSAGTSVTVSWTAPSNGGATIDYYQVYYGTSASPTTAYGSTTATTSQTLTGLTQGTTYYFRIKAHNVAGFSAAYSADCSAVPSTTPGTPTIGTATMNCGNATITWTAPASNGGSAITDYRMYVGTTSTPTTPGTLLGNVLTTNVTNLAKNTLYYYRVKAVNACGDSASYSGVVSGTTKDVPDAPTIGTPSSGCGYIRANWTAPANNGGSAITGYKIYWATTAGGSYTLGNTVGVVLTGDITTGLTKNTTYYMKVVAVNACGDSVQSSASTGVVFMGVPDAPNVTGAFSTCVSGQIYFNWTAPANNGGSAITGYKIYYATTANPTVPGTAVGNVLTATINSLANGSLYYLRVVATNACGDSAYSNSGSATPMSIPAAPTIGTATPGCGQATITWTAPADKGGDTAGLFYRYYYGTTTGPTTPGTVTGNTSVTISGLTPGTLYYFRVKAGNTCGDSTAYSSEVTCTPFTIPSQITAGLSATAGCGQATISWTAPANGGATIDYYQVYYGPSAAPTTAYGSTTGTTSQILTGLTARTLYYFRVKAHNTCGFATNYSADVSCTINGVPDAPTIGTSTSGCNYLRANWTAPANNGGSAVTGYNIYYATSVGGTYTLGGTAAYPAVTKDITTGPVKNTTYYIKVEAVNACGTGALSGASNGVVFMGIPDAPTIGTSTGACGSVTANWTAPANNGGSAITGYKIYHSTSVGGTYTLGNTVGVVLTGNVTGLTKNTTYYLKVLAINACGDSAQSSASNGVVFADVPDAPTIGTATQACVSGQVTANWTAPANNGGSAVTGYKIYYGPTTTPTTPGTAVGNVLTYNITGLTNGSAYYIRVIATNACGDSTYSGASNSITPTAIPATVGTPTVTGCVGATYLDVSWSAPANNGAAIDYYQVYFGTSSNPTTAYGSTTATTSQTINGLTSGVTYYFRVKAHNACGLSASYSANGSGPVRYIPSTTTGLTLDSTGCGSMSVHWDAPSNNGSAIDYYTIYADFSDTTPTDIYGTTASTSETLTGLTPGLVWSVRIKAHNACGSASSYSSAVSTTPYGVPGAPTIIGATPENGQSTVSWSAPASNGGSAIDYYQVYYGITASPTTPFGSTTASLSQLITGLNNGVLYYFRVVAHNACGNGAYSGDATALIAGGMSPTGGILYSFNGMSV